MTTTVEIVAAEARKLLSSHGKTLAVDVATARACVYYYLVLGIPDPRVHAVDGNPAKGWNPVAWLELLRGLPLLASPDQGKPRREGAQAAMDALAQAYQACLLLQEHSPLPNTGEATA